MFCPRCGQERVSQDTSFCSRCGFLLTAAADLLRTDGAVPEPLTVDSPRRRGVKQGLFLLMLMIVAVPVLGLTLRMFGLFPWPIGLVVFGLGGGGLLRIAYALMFEAKESARTLARDVAGGHARELPASEFPPASAQMPPMRAGAWLDTNDLQPNSVTDHTTQLLEKERER